MLREWGYRTKGSLTQALQELLCQEVPAGFGGSV